ncbi:hypothetical protein EYF80_023160 [Liparis tanakae]|uniref:Uncharacterized protein n=1 Tax=Liparis tanakae TaxID=230148 RepID=A0A4Z2HLC7_9TELE|nr:hypothetical protein EYF80_023160 [Liparis tanakae]
MQFSSDSKLLRLPAQPPYTKRTHFFWLMSKCQRRMEARQGPVSASRAHTAARGQLSSNGSSFCVGSSSAGVSLRKGKREVEVIEWRDGGQEEE